MAVTPSLPPSRVLINSHVLLPVLVASTSEHNMYTFQTDVFITVSLALFLVGLAIVALHRLDSGQ